MKKAASIIILQKWLFLSTAAAQLLRISGTVRDINTHHPISGVNISLMGTSWGTTTSPAGQFLLQIPAGFATGRLRFQHISYYAADISIDSLRARPIISLRPRIIPLPPIEVIGEAEKRSIAISRDLPQSLSLLDAKSFELRGFVDAGDYLARDVAIQVDETLSGKKSLSIRGGNADDVVVLYNGVKLNNLLDNTADLAQFSIDNLQRLEIIKGGNTALYGPEAFSGVINIVPQIDEQYLARIQYRIGTYRTKAFSVDLNKNFSKLGLSYAFQNNDATRYFVDSATSDDRIANRNANHAFDLQYRFGKDESNDSMNLLTFGSLVSSLDYYNYRESEQVKDANWIAALNYHGSMLGLNGWQLQSSLHHLDSDQSLHYEATALKRSFHHRTLHFQVQREMKVRLLEGVLGYQYEAGHLDFEDNRQFTNHAIVLQQNDLQRQHHGWVAVVKAQGPAGAVWLNHFEVDLSARHDQILDKQQSEIQKFDPDEGFNLKEPELRHHWQATSLKTGLMLAGQTPMLVFQSYLNYGANTKFPTLQQATSSLLNLKLFNLKTPLQPERIQSLELGIELTRELDHPIWKGWNMTASYFQTYYTNKFRSFSMPFIPIVFYDNVPTAKISGVELKQRLYFLQKKLTIELGLAKNEIPEKAAFPFKSEFKITSKLMVDHAGWSIELLWFHESDQIGWLRTLDSYFSEVLLPSFSNLDLHVNKQLKLWKTKLLLNFSGRNLLVGDQVLLQGLALRDRRFYLAFGFQL
ncbi:MAG: TonB-dependent receptor [candidate division KSB1 bacterium]|nr:TonB-dependent receptor [candidate division KSB1 bacterium]